MSVFLMLSVLALYPHSAQAIFGTQVKLGSTGINIVLLQGHGGGALGEGQRATEH